MDYISRNFLLGKQSTSISNVTLLYSSGGGSQSATLNTSGPTGYVWLVAAYVEGGDDGTSYSSAPLIGGVGMTLRAQQFTYYGDDGSRAQVWASPVSAATSTMTFTGHTNGYGGGAFAIWKAVGVASSATPTTYSAAAGTFYSYTPNNLYAQGCTFLAGIRAKAGPGSLWYSPPCTSDLTVYGGVGAKVYNGSTSVTFTHPTLSNVVSLSLPYTFEPVRV
jgi:hypothetical protein